jgi:uncharacterized protein
VSTNPLVVNIGALRRTPGGRQAVSRHGTLDGLAVAASHVPAGTEVSVDAVFEVAGKAIIVTGTVASPWVGECRRCLGPVTGDLEVAVREVYEPPPRLGDEPSEEMEEAETYPLAGDTLDLSPLARDALLLELPLAPLCRADCAGLCPVCGADRNASLCSCASAPANGVWAALDALRHPDSS